MIIHECAQGSEEWFKLRAGCATASDFDQLVTPEFEIRKGEMPKTYLAGKLAEAWIGTPLPRFVSSWEQEQGQILEDFAVPWYELKYGCDIRRVGFISSDDHRIGCSPDGLLGDDCGIEIKCLQMPHHTKVLLNGGLPKEFAVQVQTSLFVTGFKLWKFVAYSRQLPCMVLDVAPNPEHQKQVGAALKLFLQAMDDGYAKLVAMNGGKDNKAK